jgi:hypothetical protein
MFALITYYYTNNNNNATLQLDGTFTVVKVPGHIVKTLTNPFCSAMRLDYMLWYCTNNKHVITAG